MDISLKSTLLFSIGNVYEIGRGSELKPSVFNDLDQAFERRFLFKIKYHKPNKDVRMKIWASKLKDRSPKEYDVLASNYDFSGGQIDNVVRKSEMFEVMNGIPATIDEILKFCDTEKLKINDRGKIGFI